MDDNFMKTLVTSVILRFTKHVAGICFPSVLELLSFVISKPIKVVKLRNANKYMLWPNPISAHPFEVQREKTIVSRPYVELV